MSISDLFRCGKAARLRAELGYSQTGQIIPNSSGGPVGEQAGNGYAELGWTIGPIIAGRNYSPGMDPFTINGSFEFPVGYRTATPELYRHVPSVHYVTRSALGMAVGRRMTLRYEIVGEGPFEATEDHNVAPHVYLHFQRRGDNWSGTGLMAGFRWWSLQGNPVRPGKGEISVPLTREHWGWVAGDNQGLTELELDALFIDAVEYAERLGFTFGGPGKGHGVYAFTPGNKFIVESFEIHS
jgi:hypothetical protein